MASRPIVLKSFSAYAIRKSYWSWKISYDAAATPVNGLAESTSWITPTVNVVEL